MIRPSLFPALVLGGLLSAPSLAAEPISVIEVPTGLDQPLVELGKKLYFDPRLSRSGFISCNSCHNLSMGGTDNLPTSIGHGWHQGPINAPTVLNARYNLAQFWDGRASDLKAQAGGPMANPGEMASTHELATEVLASIPAYEREFNAVFATPGVTIDRITAAIAEFEESLVTPNSRFDQWLRGDAGALRAEEKSGYELFKSAGCAGCHNGPAVGGGAFMKMGLLAAYETDSPEVGREAVTGNVADRYVFKVPTLRNVALTYPYFHDGAVNTLDEAVELMGRLQLGRRFSPAQTAQIVAFLHTLTGEQPSFTLPILPPSVDATPRPTPFE
ncbi:MAG: cytochrome-c peroxidase [Pseudomonadales bacterium]|nr:cytochrome-c peroxidase [Pseudomonadales bacterium]